MEAQKGCSGANAKLWWAKCLPFATSHTQKQYSEIWSCDSAVWNHCLVLFHQRHVFLVCYFTNNHQHSKLLLFRNSRHLEMLIRATYGLFSCLHESLVKYQGRSKTMEEFDLYEKIWMSVGWVLIRQCWLFQTLTSCKGMNSSVEAFKYCSAVSLAKVTGDTSSGSQTGNDRSTSCKPCTCIIGAYHGCSA